MSKSPYIKNNSRLEDVISAIQVLGAYEKKTSRRLSLWISLLNEDTNYWLNVFKEHPEFFRVKEIGKKRLETNDLDDIDDEIVSNLDKNDYYVSLRWRFTYPQNYDPSQKKELSTEEISELGSSKNKLTHKPLSNSQIQSLIQTAISLHETANEIANQKKWWKPLLSGIFVIIGALIGLFSTIITSKNTNDLWEKEKLYLQYDKTVEKRFEIFENTVSIINKKSDADLTWSVFKVITKIDSSKIDYYKRNVNQLNSTKYLSNLNNNNNEKMKLFRQINQLSREYAVNISLANIFFGDSTRICIKKLKQPWWENDSIVFKQVIDAMNSEIFEYNLENIE